MCPDAELLSAFFDGEVPPPWEGRVRDHAASCPACREALERMRSLREGLAAHAASEDALIEASRERVWARLCKEGASRARASARRARTVHPGWWKRSFVLSLPAAAAALIVALVGIPAATVAVARASQPRQGQSRIIAPPVIQDAALAGRLGANQASFQDIESLLRYLDSQDNAVKITVELPADGIYTLGSMPSLMKAQTVSTEASPR